MLDGLTVLVTRAGEQSTAFRDALEARGATVMESPMIAFVEPESWDNVDAAIADLERYDGIVFTSANAADRFMNRMVERNRPVALLSSIPVATIGPATTRSLQARGVTGMDEASSRRAEGLAEMLIEKAGGSLEGRRILIPRAEKARDVLPEALRCRGARVDIVTVYATVPVPLASDVRNRLDRGGVDVITFTSGSAVKHFMEALGGTGIDPIACLQERVVAVIGPVTARALRSAGIEPDVVAPRPDIVSFADAIAAHCRSRSGRSRR